MTAEIIVPLSLILLAGIPHGAADILIARRMIRSNYLWLSLFSISYLFIAAFIVVIWFLVPLSSLIMFLIISISHFGLMDTKKTKTLPFRYLRVIIYGSTPIIIPATFHTIDVNNLFALLIFEENTVLATFIANLFPIWFLSCVIFFVAGGKSLKYQFLEILLLAVVLAYLPPLWGFAVYFCVVHSSRHIQQLLNSLGSLNYNDYLFLTVTVLMSILTIIIGAFHFSSETFDIGIIKATFISLAALTVPHMLLIDSYKGLKRLQTQ
ncbi:Brp/Blh family beta-carotene 15,15'-dioxygenase [Rhodospirillaceae bacterium]|nr:Brp/Blh family beta-carotene 15,15'-dioxygenase [Rhodospirillaceae bacterium]